MAIGAAFLLSGAAALVYELLWFRLMGHLFGSTATATATLLAAYLFGLGAGAWLFGVALDRPIGKHLVALYVGCEIVIGLYGLASSHLLERGGALFAGVHSWADGSAGKLLFGRFLVSFLLVALPTTLMGGTFPLMVTLLRRGGGDLGGSAGRAYAWNTAGAAAGALAVPFVLLPAFGLTRSLALAAACNLGAAALAGVAARGFAPDRDARGREDELADTSAAPVQALRGFSLHVRLLTAFLMSSFAAIALETVWARHMGILFGAKIHVFAFVLVSYLVGLFAGGALYARLAGRGASASGLFMGGLAVAALATLATTPFLDRMILPQVTMMIGAGVGYGTFLGTTLLTIFAVVVVPAAAFGTVFPAAIALVGGDTRRAGSAIGLTYVVNTLGTVLGALVAGFFLVPSVGTQRTLEICALSLAAALVIAPSTVRSEGAASARTSPRAFALRHGAWGVVLLACAIFLAPRWDWRLAHTQYVKDPRGFVTRYQAGTLQALVDSYALVHFQEGTEATVSVCRFQDGSRSLYVNGKADASNILGDMVVQRLLGIVPALFHPAPKEALVIGVGSGTTVAMLRRFGLTRIDAAEISPEVVDAARLHFREINEGALDDRAVRLILDDGRNVVHYAPAGSYDLVVSEPSNPWMSGVSGLFTDEFFQEVRRALRPGGIACQWFHLYTMSPEHLKLIVRTFRASFPDSALFLTRDRRFNGDLILIGSNGPLALARLPEDRTVPARIQLALGEILNSGNQAILSGLAMGPAELAAFGGAGPLNSDDRPRLELEAPVDLFEADSEAALEALLQEREIFLPVAPVAGAETFASGAEADGFAITTQDADQSASRSGVTVLTRQPLGPEPIRWVLLGRTLESRDATIDLAYLVRPLGIPDELEAIARTLAGDAPAAIAPIVVHGHDGIAATSEEGRGGTLVLGWACPERKRAYFVRRRLHEGFSGNGDSAAALAARFSCRHDPNQDAPR